jgi:hypothetical protein
MQVISEAVEKTRREKQSETQIKTMKKPMGQLIDTQVKQDKTNRSWWGG